MNYPGTDLLTNIDEPMLAPKERDLMFISGGACDQRVAVA
jgi:hypothetical protein